ncbi:MAG TPA: hypothetical protein PLU99_14450 [Phycisphaerae bacterium]|nr:hypothetical protein [Phycisphaerae bacterium]
MAWLTWFALESTLALAAALFTANFALLVMWRRTGRGRPLLAGLAVSILLLAIQGFVVTRREHAGRLLRTIERDLLTAQTTGLSAALADDFRTARMDKGQFLDFVARQYGRIRVSSLHCSQLEVRDSQPDQFTVEAAYQADLRGDFMGGWVRSRWELTFKRTADGWRIAFLRPIHIDGVGQPDLRALEP